MVVAPGGVTRDGRMPQSLASGGERAQLYATRRAEVHRHARSANLGPNPGDYDLKIPS